MNVKLLQSFLEAGLLQFGRFSGACPFRLSLELLPAYPDILRMIVIQSKSLLAPGKISRLLSTSDALPLGVGLSLEMNIPLVYSRSGQDAAVYDLVGAYDIGHPTLLLTNVLDGLPELSRMITKAEQVGLEVHTVYGIVDLGSRHPSDAVKRISLLHMQEIANYLVENGQLPLPQLQAVQSWIERGALS